MELNQAIQQMQRGQSMIAQGNDLCRKALDVITGAGSPAPSLKKRVLVDENKIKRDLRKSLFKQKKA